MRVVFTGGDPSGRTRASWIDSVAEKGWSVGSAVRRETSVLVASRGDTSKAKAARSLGVKVMTYKEFENLLATGSAHTVDAMNMPSAEKINLADLDKSSEAFGLF